MTTGPIRRTTTRVLATLLFAIVSSTGLNLAATPASATTVVALRVTPNEASFATMINVARQQNGLKPLRVVTDLTRLARSWSNSMAVAGDIWHNPRLTRQVGAWRVVGENVGVGGVVGQLNAAFMASPDHRANLLSSAYTEIGVGVVRHNGTLYVTEDFRRPVRATSPTVISPRRSISTVVRLSAAVLTAPVPTSVRTVPVTAMDSAQAAELARLLALPTSGQGDPVGSALDFLNTMRGLTT